MEIFKVIEPIHPIANPLSIPLYQIRIHVYCSECSSKLFDCVQSYYLNCFGSTCVKCKNHDTPKTWKKKEKIDRSMERKTVHFDNGGYYDDGSFAAKRNQPLLSAFYGDKK